MTRHPLLKGFAITALVGACVIGVRPALADDDDCNVPLADWKPIKGLDALAKAQGWTVSKVRTDDGCYEIRGVDRDGRRFKAKVNPATFAITRFKTDGSSRHEGRDEHGDRDSEGGSSIDATKPRGATGNQQRDPVPAGGIVKPGSKPQVQIN
ncbi:PepSY domain-containing protein [Ralstonia sp. UBA689]|uniref:PepSY domain-containing protein n=1 Tax=Ralstonia sp. UBA689 TaxID=1947373 RepID=UPI0025D3C7E9|nr:PepSY domain-containing protein [Ralstonia sp. UBA689]